LLERADFQWSYLVKVKLKNLDKLLKIQKWHVLPKHPDIAICEFTYQPSGWSNARTFKAIRVLTGYKDTTFIGQIDQVPIYEYACYISTLQGDAFELHNTYKKRATSETWIEQVKSQLLAGATLTDNFYANDILWQLSVLAYNLSVMMRYPLKRSWKHEHATFRDRFILIPALIVHSSRQVIMRIYKHYYFKEQWVKFEHVLLDAY